MATLARRGDKRLVRALSNTVILCSMIALTAIVVVCGYALYDRRHRSYVPPMKPVPQTLEEFYASNEKDAEYGGFCENRFGVIVFTEGRQAATQGLPALSISNLTNTNLSMLPNISVPFGLDLGHSGVTDREMHHLGKQSNLSMLGLFGCPITDQGLKEIKDLKRLTYLNLAATRVTDRGLKELRNLTALTHLDLRDWVTDEGLKELKPLANLRTLHAGSQITDGGLKVLRELPKLEYLSLTLSKITDAGLEEFKGFEKLVSLHLRWTKITDAGLRHLIAGFAHKQ